MLSDPSVPQSNQQNWENILFFFLNLFFFLSFFFFVFNITHRGSDPNSNPAGGGNVPINCVPTAIKARRRREGRSSELTLAVRHVGQQADESRQSGWVRRAVSTHTVLRCDCPAAWTQTGETQVGRSLMKLIKMCHFTLCNHALNFKPEHVCCRTSRCQWSQALHTSNSVSLVNLDQSTGVKLVSGWYIPLGSSRDCTEVPPVWAAAGRLTHLQGLAPNHRRLIKGPSLNYLALIY